MVLELYGRVGTVKMDAKGTVYTDVGGNPLETNGLGPWLGTVASPRLCIFPALILLLCIAVIAFALRVITGSHDFAWKVWLFLSLSASISNKSTLLNTKCAEIDFWSEDVEG